MTTLKAGTVVEIRPQGFVKGVLVVKGPIGNTGPANTLAIGTVTASDPGGAAGATITGAAPEQTLDLVIPRGNQGTGVTGLDVSGNALTYTLSDGTTGQTTNLPVAMIDSDSFVADRVNDNTSLTAAALKTQIASQAIEKDNGRVTPVRLPSTRGSLVVAGAKTPTNAAGSAASPGITFRTSYRAVADITNLRLLFVGWYDSNAHVETALPADITYKAAIEYGGTTYPVTFGPHRSVTVQPWGEAKSDPVSLVIPKGDVFYVRSLVITTGTYPTGVPGSPQLVSNGLNGYASGDVVDGTSAMTTTGTNSLWGPVAIYGDIISQPQPQIVAVADSITDGTGDDIYATSYNGASSWLTRAVGDNYGLLRLSSPGEELSNVTGQQAHRRFALIAGCTHSVLFSGTNDLWANVIDLPTLQSLFLAVATRLHDLGTQVLAPTMLPRTRTTDGWATAENQAAVQNTCETTRVQFNTWLRAGGPIDATSKAAVAIGTSGALLIGDPGHPLAKYGAAYVIETADAIETARNSGIWKPGVRTVADAAITSGSKSLTSATANFTTAADKGRMVAIQGAGASGATLSGVWITGVVDSTTVNISTAASTTVSGASATIGTYTGEGVHPSKDGHIAMAAAFDPSLLTL